MSYAGNNLKARGQDCIIVRDPIVTTKLSLKRSTRAPRNAGERESYWEGLILSSAGLKSGEIVTFRGEDYLTQTVDFDPASCEDAVYLAKANAILQHMREVEDVDENGNITKDWHTINPDIPSFGSIVTYSLRQFDPGLLPGTRYIFQVPKNIGVVELDRVVYGEGPNNKYQVDSIDDIALKGIVRIQVSVDTRP